MNQVYRFCVEMKKGDLVIILSARSADFAFGILTSDDFYTETVSNEDIEDGACPYTKRRPIKWITSIKSAYSLALDNEC